MNSRHALKLNVRTVVIHYFCNPTLEISVAKYRGSTTAKPSQKSTFETH